MATALVTTRTSALRSSRNTLDFTEDYRHANQTFREPRIDEIRRPNIANPCGLCEHQVKFPRSMPPGASGPLVSFGTLRYIHRHVFVPQFAWRSHEESASRCGTPLLCSQLFRPTHSRAKAH